MRSHLLLTTEMKFHRIDLLRRQFSSPNNFPSKRIVLQKKFPKHCEETVLSEFTEERSLTQIWYSWNTLFIHVIILNWYCSWNSFFSLQIYRSISKRDAKQVSEFWSGWPKARRLFWSTPPSCGRRVSMLTPDSNSTVVPSSPLTSSSWAGKVFYYGIFMFSLTL